MVPSKQREDTVCLLYASESSNFKCQQQYEATVPFAGELMLLKDKVDSLSKENRELRQKLNES